MNVGTGTGTRITGTTQAGPYCDHADILAQLSPDVLIQLTDDTSDGVANMSRVTQAIATADAEIDGYCAGRYTVPFSPVPAVIKGLSVEIAVYYLYKRRTVPERIEKSYDKAVARLKDISRGLLTLGTTPDSTPAPANSGGISVTENARIFTRDTMKGF
jgi:phage gp36-like protein